MPDSGVVELAAGTFPMADTLDTNGRPLTIQGAVDEDQNPLSILDGQDTRRVVQCISGEDNSPPPTTIIQGRFPTVPACPCSPRRRPSIAAGWG